MASRRVIRRRADATGAGPLHRRVVRRRAGVIAGPTRTGQAQLCIDTGANDGGWGSDNSYVVTCHKGHRITAHAGWRYATRIWGLQLGEEAYREQHALQKKVLSVLVPLFDTPLSSVALPDAARRLELARFPDRGPLVGIVREGRLVTVYIDDRAEVAA